MAASFDKRFSFPVNVEFSQIPGFNCKVCVVAIFGKSRLNPFSSKATCLNSVIDKDVFLGTEGYLKEQINQGKIECFYDTDSRVIYLHLLSFTDINYLARECQLLTDDNNVQNFYSKWQSEDFALAKNLAFLFTISHIVLLCHPGSCFDLSYLRLFHNLDNMRLKLQPHISDLLASMPGVSKDWARFGRVCTPRMLFLFETPTIDVHPEESDGTSNKSAKKFSPIKKLQMAIEDTIFKILRKTRAITNISNNSLFSVPLNQPFVYIQARKSEICDPIDFLLTQIKAKCFPTKEESPYSGASTAYSQGQGKPKPYSACRRFKANPPAPEPLPLSSPSWKSSALRNIVASTSSSQQKMPAFSSAAFHVSSVSSALPPSSTSSSSSSSSSSSMSSSGPRGQEQSLKEFLWQHIEMVFARKVNDNMGRHGIESVFELPNFDTWLQSSNCLHDFFFPKETSDPSVSQYFSHLQSSLDISMRFSESRCQKWVSTAESTYQQDLPPFYVTSFHQNRLSKAKRVFSQYARGPAFHKYLQELELWCEAYWKAGRQQCEAVSLSGNLCTLQCHRLPQEALETVREDLPVAEHCTNLKTRSACNCGRKQVDKDDPFTHKYTNYTFYQALESLCCGSLEHITLPVFTATTPDPSPVAQRTLSSSHDGKKESYQRYGNDKLDNEKIETFSTLSDMSWALSLDQTGTENPDASGKMSPIKLSQTSLSSGEKVAHPQKDVLKLLGDEDAIVLKTEDLTLEEKSKQTPVKQTPERQISTTEYLSGMIHTKSPSGLLPKFSSFSLCRLGPAGLYSHNIGFVDLPGFLPGSSFLLPWDITVKQEAREKWPSMAETFGGAKKRQQRKQSKVTMESSETQTTVRVYLGMEYECPRGHRFFCSGPDKIIKVSANSAVKDNAGRLVHMDMPLYTLCHCKQPKGCMAQMMRVYVVTPRDSPNCPPVRVQANPIIQPNPPPCPQFHPGLNAALELPPDGVWVLRLPHVYQDDECIYLMPSDPQSFHSCYLIKGTFSHRTE